MSDKDIEPTGQPEEPEHPSSNEPPIDDSGINNDYILDLCDFVINSLWDKYIGGIEEDKTRLKTPTSEIKDLAYTLQVVWGLCQDILDIDRRLRGQVDDDDFPPGPFGGEFHPFNPPPTDPDEGDGF